MAALAADRSTPAREGEIITAGVKKETAIFAGSLVVKEAGGYAEPGKKAGSLVVLGRAEHSVTGGAADGDVTVKIRRGVFAWENSAGAGEITAALVGEKAYVADDQTVTKTASGATAAGKIIAVDSEGVWVETR